MNRQARPNNKGFTPGPNREGGVPGTIKCQVCSKMKSKTQYSNRQLLKYSSYNKGYTRNPDSIKLTCTDCTASQTVELTCYICSQTKGLDGFAKTQRKDPDNARCKKCVDKVLETEPDIHPPDSDDDEDDESESEWDEAPAGRARAKPASRTQWGDSEYPESPPPSQNGSSFSSSNLTSIRSQAPPGQHRSNTSSDAGDVWVNVAKSTPQPRNNLGAPSIDEDEPYTTRKPYQESQGTKTNKWAKVKKAPKDQEVAWSKGKRNDDEINEDTAVWDRYGRDIRDQKAGKARK